MAHKMKGGKGRKLRRPAAGSRKGGRVVEGTLEVVRPGSATLHTEEGSFSVARRGLREGMNGDVVRATLVRSGPGEPVAYVQSVMQRAVSTFLGSYSFLSPLGAVVPLDTRIQRDFFVLPEDHSAQKLGVADGDIVSARIVSYPTRKEAGVVTIERRVGAAVELNLDIEAVIASYGLQTEFPETALAEARALSCDVDEVLARDPLRRDMRNTFCLTIDPTDARDFDDAVSAVQTENGFELSVHIADVTHFVEWGGSLDLEARARTTSVYLVDRVLPMLPEELSNNLCSLRPGEDKLCMSVNMQLDAMGNVLSAGAYPSAIRSSVRLSYDEADAILKGRSASEFELNDAVAGELTANLQALNKISELRQLLRKERGAIDFESVEPRVMLDEAGKPARVEVRTKTPATQLIEEAMLLANESVAKMLVEHAAPSAFRVHEQPNADALKQLLPVLRELDLAKGKQGDRLAAGDPFAIQEVLEEAEGTSAEYLVSTLLLRAQQRAIYLPQNEGHYALGADAYCHFTSPIRRYPDVLVHRTLKAVLTGELSSKDQREAQGMLALICQDCSNRERVADAAARASQKIKMAELFEQHLGESFSGVVVGVERYGLFVMLDDSCAEGLLPVRALGDEWFVHDDARMTLTGEETGKLWRLGMRIAVRVEATNPARGQIDFVLAGSSD